MTCSFAVRGALKKFAEVQKAEVSLNRGVAAVTLKPGNKVKVTDLWDVVTRNGFTTKTTTAVIRGEILPGGKQLRIPESGEVYTLAETSSAGAQAGVATFDAMLKPGTKGVEAEITPKP